MSTRSLKSVHFYTGLSSCFNQAGCNNVLSIITEPSCLQASISVELTVFNNCSKHPSFGMEGTKTALYCKTHKTAESVDVKHKKCTFNGCKINAKFGVEGTSTP